MQYADEPYVRLYVNDTATWAMLGWQGRCVLLLLLKGKFDRSGVFEHGRHAVSRAVTAVTGLPEEHAKEGVRQLLEGSVLEAGEGCLIWPKFVEAQTTARTPTARKREERKRNQARHRMSRGVTPSHAESHAVTFFTEAEAEAEAETEIPPVVPPANGQGSRAVRRRWRRVPSGWSPSEQHTVLAQQLRVDLKSELSKFRDHEFATPRSDADAAFRNWLRKAGEGRGQQRSLYRHDGIQRDPGITGAEKARVL